MNKFFFLSFFVGHLFASNLLIEDQKNMYSEETLTLMSITLIPAGIMANSSIDQTMSDYYKSHIRSKQTDSFSRTFKNFGNRNPLLLSLAAISAAGFVITSSTEDQFLFTFGTNSLRSILVGALPLIAGQNLIGADRPRDGTGSSWRPLKNDHALSGHAFMGAIPFITAAKLTSYPPLKIALYITSTFTGISRINDDMHYPSQVLLGWMLAYASCDAITRSNTGIKITPNSITLGTTF